MHTSVIETSKDTGTTNWKPITSVRAVPLEKQKQNYVSTHKQVCVSLKCLVLHNYYMQTKVNTLHTCGTQCGKCLCVSLDAGHVVAREGHPVKNVVQEVVGHHCRQVPLEQVQDG